MKKKILVKTLIKESLVESSIKIGDKDYEQRLRRRIIDLRRVAQRASEAAKKAEEAGKEDLAKKLNDRVEEIEKLLDTYNTDTIDSSDDLGTEVEDNTDTEAENDNKEDDAKEDNSEGTDSEDDTKEDGEEAETQDSKGDINGESDTLEDPEKDDNKDSEDPLDNPEKDKEDSDDSTDGDESEDDTQEGHNGENSEDEDTEDDGSGDTEDSEDDDELESDDEDQDSSKKSKSKGNGEDEDEDNDEESETDDDPVEDPFADEEDIPDLNLGGGTQEPRKATLKDIIKQLKGLPSEAKKGAIAALNDILNSHSTFESLTEAVKGVREMTDDEFGDYINSTYDLIDEVEDIDYIDEKELQDKKTKVGQWSTDPATLKELEKELEIDIKKDQIKSRERESEKYKKEKVGTLAEFEINFYNAIKNQVETVIQDYKSYSAINAEYESEDVIMKADLTQEIPEEVIPIVDIYFDVSGSWTQADIDIGKKAIAVVKEFEDAGEVKLNIFYFGDEVSSNYSSVAGGGTYGWQKILKNIKATGAQNIMVMTDDDIESIGEYAERWDLYKQYSAAFGPTVKVDGCVWYLWKNGLASPSCVQHLNGRQGTYQYAFYR